MRSPIGPHDPIWVYSPLFGSWEPVFFIGAGTFGRVYQVERTDMTGTMVGAVKMIRVPQDVEDWQKRAGTSRDYDAIAESFKHDMQQLCNEVVEMRRFAAQPHFVPYRDHILIENKLQISETQTIPQWVLLIRMDLLMPLDEWLMDHQPTEAVIRQIGMDLCDALIALEKNKVLHRDIKEENVFVNADGLFCLGDFSVARTSAATMALTKAGTQLWMAPEVYRNEPYNRLADLYSVGILLYQLANRRRFPFEPLGRVPTQTDRAQALTQRLQSKALPLPVDVSKELGAVICKACAYQPSQRYKNAAEMKGRLESLPPEPAEKKAKSTLPGAASREDPPEAKAQPARQGFQKRVARLRLFVSVLLLLALVAVAIVIIRSYRGEGGIELATAPVSTATTTDASMTPAPVALAVEDSTPTPTTEETAIPTAQPTATPAPTASATRQPTVSPTDTPVPTDTSVPTNTPVPTGTPTLAPTQPPAPTDAPVAASQLAAALTSKPKPIEAPVVTPSSSPEPTEVPQATEASTTAPEPVEAYHFTDAGVEKVARLMLQKEEGEPITRQEWKAIPHFPSWDWYPVDAEEEAAFDAAYFEISSLEDFRHCGELQALHIEGENGKIQSLEPLRELSNLIDLSVTFQQITDVTPLQSLSALEFLALDDNPLADWTPIAGLTNLTALYLNDCGITDISQMEKLHNLTTLELSGNQIVDISSLAGLEQLHLINLENNLIEDDTQLVVLRERRADVSLAGNPVYAQIAGEVSNPDDFEIQNDTVYDYSGTALNIVIPEGVTSLAWSSRQMQNLSLPKSLRTIDEYVYYQWSNLENIDIADGNKQFLFEDGILYSKDKTVLYRMLPKHASEHFSVPEGVLHIGPWAFYGCQLQSMDLPESLLSIGKDAFTNTGISGLFIPQNVVHIEGALWTYWQTEVTIAPENPHLMSVDGVIFDSAGKTLLYYPNAREAKHYEIPAGVERIGDSAFTMVESLETLTFPAGLKEIGETAFFSCNNLTEVYLPEGVKQIGRQAFDYCEKLTVLVIPASATEIYSYLCENSPGVTIYGVPGSEAERVAEECKRPFADIATLDLPETHKPQETPAPEEPDASETEQEVKSLSIQEGSGPLMLREAPDKDAEIVLKIGKGAIVQLLGEPDENNWVQLTCDGVSGYAHAKYIQTYDWTETYTWKAYLDIVHNALKASGQETVVIPSPAFVEGYQVESHALVVPEGKALVIQGGQFESMSLGSGNITLAGVTVIAKDEEQSAIYLPAMRSSAELNLIIGQDTRVVATGTRGHGIGSEFIRQQSTGIALVNHGTIASEQSIAVDLQMSVSGKNQISVQVYNDGIMEGALFGPVRVNVFTQNGPIDVEIINAGQLLTSGDWGLDISLNTEKATPTARVENQQNALIQSLGWAVSMEMQVEKGDETLGEGTLINRGEIVAGGPETIAPTDDDCAVRFSTGTHLPVPIRLINEGTLKNRGIAPLFDLWLEQSYSNERDLLTQEEVTAIALPWLQQMGFGEYPEGTEAEILLFAGSNIWNTDIKYRYTVENSGL